MENAVPHPSHSFVSPRSTSVSRPEISVVEEESHGLRRRSAGVTGGQPWLVLEAIGEGVHGIDLEGRIIFENPASISMLGYEADEMIGLPAHATIHHHHADGSPHPEEECPIYQTLRDGRARRVRNDVFLRKNGGSFAVDYVATPTRDSAGTILGVTVAFTDATERVRAELALRASEERFRSMAEAIPQLVWMANPDGFHTYFNSRWYEFTGLTPRASLGHNWALASHPADQARARKKWAEATESGEPYEIEYRLRDAQGSFRWVLGRAVPLRGADGSIHQWMGTCTDIDELKEALEVARASEEARARTAAQLEHEQARLTEIFEQSPNFTAVVRGPDHVFAFANDAYRDLVGHRELIGKPVGEALPDIAGQGFLELLDRVLETGESVQLSGAPILLQRHPDAAPERRYIDFTYQALVDVGGSRVGVISQGSDVTERHEAEEQVRFQASLLEAVGEAVVATCRDKRVLFWNREAESLYGWTAEEALGRPIGELVPSQGSESGNLEILARLQSGGKWSGELVVQRQDGSAFPAYVSNTPLHDAEGRLVGVVGVSTDLTERRALEESLRQSQRLEAIGRMAGGISHDFNNVLTAIMGNAEMLVTELREDDPALQSVQEITDAARRASDLTHQLLAFSRQQVLEPKMISLTEVLGDLHGMLQRVLRDDIELVVSASGAGTVLADPSQISQVILNLAINARDAMPDGGVLTIRLEDVEVAGQGADRNAAGVPPGAYVRLTVGDTGEGMDSETRARIWEPFFTTKTDGKGTGLGLASVYGIVTQSGGVVTVESEPGKGAAFAIYLPLAEGAAPGRAPAESNDRPLPTGTSTILLCDDDESVRGVARRILERAGYRVLEAASGLDALALAEAAEQPPDLLVTDVVMPRMGGRELVARLHDRWPETKVLMISGYAGDDLSDPEAFEFESRFLAKPFSATDLRATVVEVLDARESDQD